MSPAFPRRIEMLVQSAGGKKPLARRLGVTDSAINSWLAGSKPFNSKLREACDHSGIAIEWLRDGRGPAEVELAKVSARPPPQRYEGEESRLREDSPQFDHGSDGWRTIVRVLADRLNPTQIAEAMKEVLAHTEIGGDVRNATASILSEALLPKLKR